MESDRLLALILVALLVAGVWIGLSVYRGDTYVHLLTGKEESVALTLAMQISLGEDLASDFEQQLGGLVDDPQAQGQVNRIELSLIQALTKMENMKQARSATRLHWAAFNLQFKVLNSDKLNAFALPNGSLYITKGLLKNLRSDDQANGVRSSLMRPAVRRNVLHDHADGRVTEPKEFGD